MPSFVPMPSLHHHHSSHGPDKRHAASSRVTKDSSNHDSSSRQQAYYLYILYYIIYIILYIIYIILYYIYFCHGYIYYSRDKLLKRARTCFSCCIRTSSGLQGMASSRQPRSDSSAMGSAAAAGPVSPEELPPLRVAGVMQEVKAWPWAHRYDAIVINRIAAFAFSAENSEQSTLKKKVRRRPEIDDMMVHVAFQQQHLKAFIDSLPSTVTRGTVIGYRRSVKRVLQHLDSNHHIDSSTVQQLLKVADAAFADALAAAPRPDQQEPVVYPDLQAAVADISKTGRLPPHISLRTRRTGGSGHFAVSYGDVPCEYVTARGLQMFSR